MQKSISCIFLACMFLMACQENDTAKNVSSDPKIEELLSKMSVEEKVGQMTQVTIDLILKDNSTTEVDPEKLKKAIIEKNVGSILNVKGHAYSMEVWHSIINQIQAVANTSPNRIPVLYGIDAIHGANYIEGSVLYPHNIGMAATRNPELSRQSAAATAALTRASGIRWNFDPVLDIGREPLWPRFEETFGEDVYLVSEFGSATINGYQEKGLNNKLAVAACMKHFLGYSLPASGKDRTPAYIPENMLREYVLPPFEAAVKAGVATVMINSAEINGIPVHGSKYYLTEILRNELGFKGVAVSDWEDVIRLHTRHKVADSPKEAVRLSVEAGLDMSMVPVDYSFYDLLLELVKEGKITEARLDESVRRILKLKLDLGLFEGPAVEKTEPLNPESDRALALQSARESITLLENDNNTLPLSKNKKVLLAGPAANNLSALFSSWSYTWQGQDLSRYPQNSQTIKQAMEQLMGNGNVISSAKENYDDATNFDVVQLKKDAQKADYIVLCIGENAYAESPGVIDDLGIDPKQLALVEAALSTGKPVILVLVEGRPRIIASVADKVQGVLMAYRPSTMGAQAIAEVLLGDYNPSGILPFTYPRATGDILFYDHKFSEEIREDVPNTYGNRGFNPQWNFGFGLSYSTFEFSGLKVDKTNFTSSDALNVEVTVKNTGDRDGMISVELYSKDLYASTSPNVRRLRKFTKISLAKGESKTVNFTINANDLSFINEAHQRVTELGDFELQIGNQSVKVAYQ